MLGTRSGGTLPRVVVPQVGCSNRQPGVKYINGIVVGDRIGVKSVGEATKRSVGVWDLYEMGVWDLYEMGLLDLYEMGVWDLYEMGKSGSRTPWYSTSDEMLGRISDRLGLRT